MRQRRRRRGVRNEPPNVLENLRATTASDPSNEELPQGQERKDNEEIEALRHEITSTVKMMNTVTMDAVGGMQSVKDALLDAIILPKKSAQRPGLALLYGPSGTGERVLQPFPIILCQLIISHNMLIARSQGKLTS